MRLVLTSLILALFLVSSDALADDDRPPDREEAYAGSNVDPTLPTTEADPAGSSPLIWIAPIILGVFAFLLVMFIRGYSGPRRQKKAQDDLK